MTPVSVIISTYNHPEWLRKALWGFEVQTEKNFEIVIADDGSSKETQEVIADFQKNSSLNITHVWQEDKGFQKTKILNKAIVASKGTYLIFTDGDCIPRQDLVATHLRLKKPGCFLSGGYFKLPLNISEVISREDIIEQRCFDVDWLVAKGIRKSFKLNKLTASIFKQKLLNTFTPTKATWDGNNASGWREDIIVVNGFDERMQYGGEDREMGERLMNLGVRPRQVRYGVITMHLFHERGYVTDEMVERNNQIRKETRKNKSIWTNFGIKQRT